MKNISEIHEGGKYTDRVIQFGEGNFLRCFVDWQIDRLNEEAGFDAGITLLRPIDTEYPPSLNTQNGLYTTVIRGINESKEVVKEFRIIRSVKEEVAIYKDYRRFLELAKTASFRYIFSNTTEAGIAFDPADKFDETPPRSFPAKLTRFLYERYRVFSGDINRGFIIIPCELIDYNGEILKGMVEQYISLWNLEPGFKSWLEEANTFCSTLVDRIVTGYPKEEIHTLEAELGYKDAFITTGEYFYLFVIQGPPWLTTEFKLDMVDLNIKIVEDIKPYKTRKVGLLNGAHTIMVPVGYLCGLDYVKECMDDELTGKFIRETLFKEIIPAVEMDEKELAEFADAVIDRFKNPFIKHPLLSISLNSMTKFRTRVLPQILNYLSLYGKLPRRLVFALAALIAFYRGRREGRAFELKDDAEILALYENLWKEYDNGTIEASGIAEKILGLERNWEQDLNRVDGLKEAVSGYLALILEKGMKQAVLESF